MSKYAAIIGVINLVILISSTACLYLASIMINIYLLPYLELITSHFATAPYLILSIGSLLLVFSLAGMVAAGTQSRPMLIIYSVLMAFVVVLQLASIFVSMELRQQLKQKTMFHTVPEYNAINDEMRNYWVDEDVKFKWDTLQRDFQCCGALHLQTGYTDWNFGRAVHGERRQTRGVPDSCCLKEQPGCGDNIFDSIVPWERIYTHGCFGILEERLLRDISPILLSYIVGCVVLALLTIVSLVLAAAFAASINRKKHREDELGMYEHPHGNQPGRNRYDETSVNGLYPPLDSGLGGRGSLRGSETNTPPRTPIIKPGNSGTGSHRASLYIEPTNESETCI